MLMLKFMLCATILTLSLAAAVQAAESPQISQGFGCNFLEGKGSADLDKWAAHFDKERAKIDSPELQNMRSVVWMPFRGNVAVDFVWFDGNLTFNEWGKMSDAWDRSKVGPALDASFDEVATCASSGLSSNERLSQSEKQFADDGEVMIESYRCELHPGKTIADSDAALEAWKPVFEKAVKATNTASFVGRRIPMISGSGYDLSYFLVWDDATAYAAGNSAFTADPDSAESGQLFNAAHKCTSALFKGRVVARPAS